MLGTTTKHVVREWYWQRLSAVLLALLLPTTFFLVLCLRSESMTYIQFIHFLSSTPVQIAHSLILMAFCIHLWIGLKIILEDYVALAWRMISLGCISLLMLYLFLWSMKVIWGLGL